VGKFTKAHQDHAEGATLLAIFDLTPSEIRLQVGKPKILNPRFWPNNATFDRQGVNINTSLGIRGKGKPVRYVVKIKRLV
jgi:hypothetical protein